MTTEQCDELWKYYIYTVVEEKGVLNSEGKTLENVIHFLDSSGINYLCGLQKKMTKKNLLIFRICSSTEDNNQSLTLCLLHGSQCPKYFTYMLI